MNGEGILELLEACLAAVRSILHRCRSHPWPALSASRLFQLRSFRSVPVVLSVRANP